MFYFTNKKGEKLSYDTTSIVALHSNISTPSYSYIRESTDTGKVITLDRHLNSRSINVQFLLKADDFNDTYLLRDELYRLLATEEELYLHEDAVPYKRWRVELEGDSMGDKGYSWAHYNVQFIAPLGLAESLASTLSPKLFSEDKWQFGMGLNFESLDYVSNKTSFKVDNIGDVAVDPRKMDDFTITFIGASSNLRIVNKTTGDEWKYNGSTTSADKVVLQGVTAFKNNTNIFGSTNMELITLAKGVNEFQIYGTSGTILTKVDSLFYYY